MAAICPSVVRGRMARITKVDACGVPISGPSSVITFSSFVSIASSPQYEDATPIRIEGANGVLCVDDPGCPQFSQIDNTFTFCRVDPDLFTAITGDPVVLNDATPTPQSVGFRIDGQDLCNSFFALEVWSDISGQTCTVAADKQYWYHLYPFNGSAMWGDYTVENGLVQFTITTSTRAGSGWGVGPHNVIKSGVVPAPAPLLTAIGANTHYHGQVTTLAPPAAACGATSLP